jgi:[acyl-carrier-protein] S-malonyltransferase
VLAILAPGQGAQQQGFLSPWLEVPGFGERLAVLGTEIGQDLVAAGTVMSDSDISDTAVAQPLIVAAGLAALPAVVAAPDGFVYAGHSVGEFTAAVAAGVLDPAAAMRLIGVRGAAMAAASAAAPSGMIALLGGDEAAVLDAISNAGCVAANFNAVGQIVAAGTTDALERLLADPPAGARLRPLAVAGGFHTSLMTSAQVALAAAAADVVPHDSADGLLSNADGALVTSGSAVLARLVAQVCLPVRWDACVATMSALGVTAVIELPPAGTLTALIRRALPGVQTVAVRTPEDLAAARELVAQHSTQPTERPSTWQLLVAPAGGTVRVTASADVAAGVPFLHVATRSEDLAVVADAQSTLIELLVTDGDPVNVGQPLARVSVP